MVSIRTDGITCTAHGGELTVWRAKAGVSDRLGGGRADVAELSPFLQPKAPTHPPTQCLPGLRFAFAVSTARSEAAWLV